MSATSPPIVPRADTSIGSGTPTRQNRGVIAGIVGNVLEWYDFALFGFFARQIGAHFFPTGDPTSSLLAAFGTFAAGFLMRPIGGALFGWIGDRFGRKQALMWSVFAMAFPSFFIGVLPGAETIGLAAPVLLLALRLLQGLAVGGEYMTSAVFLVESADAGRRGWMGSWGQFGATAGTLLGSAAGAIVNATMSPESVMAYGWRIPFIIGVGVGVGGLAVRRRYVERVPQETRAESPLGEAFRVHWRAMLHLVLLVASLSVGFYTTFVYSATWLGQVAQVPARTAFSVNTLAMGVSLIVTVVAGWASDLIGRRPMLIFTAAALTLMAYPLMALMARGTLPSILAGEIGLAFLVAMNGGVMAATMAELAPWRVRATVLSIAYNVTLAVLGGTTPLVAAWLVSRTGVALAPAIYLSGAAVLTLIGATRLPKVARYSLTMEFPVTRPAAGCFDKEL